MRVPYGTPRLVTFPLLDGGATEDFEATPVTIAAGDVKVWTDNAASANADCTVLGFDGWDGAKPDIGDVLHETGAGDGQGTLAAIILVSGAWATDAAGYFFLHTVSGTWTNDVAIDNDTKATTDDGDVNVLDATLPMVHVGEGMYAVCLSPTETTCRQGHCTIRDATATEEWADTAFDFVTEGHEDAFDPQGCILTDTIAASGTTASNIRLSGAPASVPRAGYYFEITSSGAGDSPQESGYIKTYTAGATYDIVPYTTLAAAPDSGSAILKVYRSAPRAPVQLVGAEDDAITAASINTGALTADAFAADAIVAATLATGALTADAFAADAIVAATLATGALTADAFAADAIVAATLATGAITADAFAANAIVDATFAAGAFAKVLTTALTEAYSTDGSTLTLTQALYELVQRGEEIAITGTSMVIKKRDGSTTAKTLTLGDATDPTTVTRAS